MCPVVRVVRVVMIVMRAPTISLGEASQEARGVTILVGSVTISVVMVAGKVSIPPMSPVEVTHIVAWSEEWSEPGTGRP